MSSSCEWESCSKTCKSDGKCGVRVRVAESCVPEYAACNEIQVQREDCNCDACPPPEPEPEPGHYEWFDWEKCSQSCSGDGFCGVQVRYAKSCEPAGAVCYELPVQRKDCGCQACPPEGQIEWHEWEKCSQSCSSDGTCGVQVRYAKGCTPATSACSDIQVQRKDCGCNSCPAPAPALTELPIGSIIPWVPKPSSSVSNTVNYNSYKGWIKCDGVEACSDGPFKSKKCTDLADRTLIGSYGSYKTLNVYGATFPDHKHPHTHTTKDHTHVATHAHTHGHEDRWHSGSHHCGGNHSSRCPDNAIQTRNPVTNPASSDKVTVNNAKVTVNTASTGVDASTIVSHGNKATLGDLYPKHMRVEYIFKCF